MYLWLNSAGYRACRSGVDRFLRKEKAAGSNPAGSIQHSHIPAKYNLLKKFLSEEEIKIINYIKKSKKYLRKFEFGD